jgi:DNA polymerase-1
MSKKLLLIDGYSLLFRAFYGMPLTMSAPDGTHTNAVYGFITILHKMIEEEAPDYLAAPRYMAPTLDTRFMKNIRATARLLRMNFMSRYLF